MTDPRPDEMPMVVVADAKTAEALRATVEMLPEPPAVFRRPRALDAAACRADGGTGDPS